MKQLIFLVFLLLAVTVTKAQTNRTVEIINLENQSLQTANGNKLVPLKNYKFAIRAHEEAEVSLKFFLKLNGNLNVLVSDKNNRVVYSKKYTKKGENSMAFTMEEGEEYTISVSDISNSDFTVSMREMMATL